MIKGIIVVIFTFLLAGCIAKPTHTMSSYELHLEPAVTKSVSKGSKVIKIKYPTALGNLNSSRIFYKKDGKVSYYLYSKWSSALNRLIYKDILLALKNSNRYKDVLSYSSSAIADRYLEVEIIDFYHVVNANASYAKVAIDIKVIDAKSSKIVKTKSYRYKKDLNIANAQNFVNSAKEALREFLVDLNRDLR